MAMNSLGFVLFPIENFESGAKGELLFKLLA